MTRSLRLALQDITLDARLQPRAQISQDTVQQYAERMTEGDTFPPIIVYYDGDTHWLADGFHRFYAARERNEQGITAEVRAGGFDDALECSAGANATHGMPRTRADTRRAIAALLKTERWVGRADRWLAEVVGCTGLLVRKVREELEAGALIMHLPELTGKDGKVYPRNQAKPAPQPEPEPQRIPLTLRNPTERDSYFPPSRPEPEPIAMLDRADALPVYASVIPAPALFAVEPPPEPKSTFTLADWAELSPTEQAALLALRHQTTAKRFNEQKGQDNIEWARWSWNPVTGCKHNCIYCYARDIAERFYPHKFEPAIIPERLAVPYTQVPPEGGGPGYRNVFTCSMADLWGRWVPQAWIDAVLATVTDNPQWNFLMLTKFPGRMAEQAWPSNAWVGTSVDTQARVAAAEKAFANVKAGVKWLSCEPMLEPLKFSSLAMFDWVVIGGQTRSTQAPEFQPKWEWIEDLLWQARQAGCKVYFKTNLHHRPREYPE